MGNRPLFGKPPGRGSPEQFEHVARQLLGLAADRERMLGSVDDAERERFVALIDSWRNLADDLRQRAVEKRNTSGLKAKQVPEC